MFKKEKSIILKGIKGAKVVWYPIEKLCLVLSRSGRQRVYKKIPKKYKRLFNLKEEEGEFVWE